MSEEKKEAPAKKDLFAAAAKAKAEAKARRREYVTDLPVARIVAGSDGDFFVIDGEDNKVLFGSGKRETVKHHCRAHLQLRYKILDENGQKLDIPFQCRG